jgi:hypothetical protein
VTRSRGRLGVLIVAATLLVLAGPCVVSAHVNRTVGRYSILVSLIGEPYFVTNRAGFDVWVTVDGEPVPGLETALSAQATGPTGTVPLELTAMPDGGHYEAEVDTDGREFDPSPGGAWTFRLLGSMGGLPIDEPFPVTFPAYPRVEAWAEAVPVIRSTSASVDPASSMLPTAGVVLVLSGVGLAGATLLLGSRWRLPVHPTLTRRRCLRRQPEP